MVIKMFAKGNIDKVSGNKITAELFRGNITLPTENPDVIDKAIEIMQLNISAFIEIDKGFITKIEPYNIMIHEKILEKQKRNIFGDLI